MDTSFEIMLTFYCICSFIIFFFVFLSVNYIYKKIDLLSDNSSAEDKNKNEVN